MLNIFKKEETKNSEPVIAIIMGKSGCGKGTQVELFKKKIEERNGNKTLHIESGAFLREFIKGDTFTEKLTKSVVESGGLVIESTLIGLWANYLNKNFSGRENILFDGCPRKLMEAELLDGTLKFYKTPKYKVIHVNVSDEWATKRLLARGRKDDTPEGIAKRMEWYEKEVMQSINFFKANPACDFIDVNGEQSIEEVHAEILSKVFGE
jgi:adenylate kinase